MKYAELHCKTNFSFLEGGSHAPELVDRAVELGYAALAVTDRNTLAGVVRAHAAAKESRLRLIIGAELILRDAPPVVLWAPDRAAYGRLARLITLGRRRAVKGDCELTFDDLAQHTGLLAGLVTTAEPFPHVHPRTSRSGPSADHRLPAERDTGSPPSGVPARVSRAANSRNAAAVPGPVCRSRLSAGRLAARSGRSSAIGRIARRNRGAAAFRWWLPATCSTTCRGVCPCTMC